nr:hypothetical protein [Tanacetum cinerariifolium]
HKKNLLLDDFKSIDITFHPLPPPALPPPNPPLLPHNPPPPPLLTTEPTTTTTTRPPVMVIDDKSWTLLGRHERELYIGLEKFVNQCKPEGVIVVVDDPDIIHFDNSSDLPLSTSLNDLDNATLHMSTDFARSHGGDGGCKRKPNLGGRAAGRLNTRDKTRNLSLKEIMDTKGPVPIQFELRDKQTVMPLGDHAAHWSGYIGEVIRGVPLYYPSWLKTQFDFKPHMESPDWTEINAGIQQHLEKAYNTNKATFKAQHWVIDPTTGSYNVEKIRRERPENITASEWDKYIEF